MYFGVDVVEFFLAIASQSFFASAEGSEVFDGLWDWLAEEVNDELAQLDLARVDGEPHLVSDLFAGQVANDQGDGY